MEISQLSSQTTSCHPPSVFSTNNYPLVGLSWSFPPPSIYNFVCFSKLIINKVGPDLDLHANQESPIFVFLYEFTFLGRRERRKFRSSQLSFEWK